MAPTSETYNLVILGGGGPRASAYFHYQLIDTLCHAGRHLDTEFPEILHYSRNFGKLDFAGNLDIGLLTKELEVRSSSWPAGSRIAIPCNTLSAVVPMLPFPVFRTADIAVKACLKQVSGGVGKVKVLASPFLMESGYFVKALKNVMPSLEIEQEEAPIMQLAITLLASAKHQEAGIALLDSRLRGADLYLFGCSELSLAFPVLKENHAIVDSVNTLIEFIKGDYFEFLYRDM